MPAKDQQEPVALSVRLPHETWRKLKILSMDNKTSIKALIELAVTRYLKEVR